MACGFAEFDTHGLLNDSPTFFFFFSRRSSKAIGSPPHLAKAPLGIYAVCVLLALGADVARLLAHEAFGVGQATVSLLGLGAHSQSVFSGSAIEANTGIGLH